MRHAALAQLRLLTQATPVLTQAAPVLTQAVSFAQLQLNSQLTQLGVPVELVQQLSKKKCERWCLNGFAC
jgi:hypothetical protein